MQKAGRFAGGAVGPLLSGALTTALSWRYVFWLDAVIGAPVVVGAWALVPRSRSGRRTRRWDMPGLVLGTAAVAALAFGLVDGARLGWSAPAVVSAFVVAAGTLGVFVVVEARARHRWSTSPYFGAAGLPSAPRFGR